MFSLIVSVYSCIVWTWPAESSAYFSNFRLPWVKPTAPGNAINLVIFHPLLQERRDRLLYLIRNQTSFCIKLQEMTLNMTFTAIQRYYLSDWFLLFISDLQVSQFIQQSLDSDGSEYGRNQHRNSNTSEGAGDENITKVLPTVFKWDGGGKQVFITGTFSNWKTIPMVRR